MGKLWVKGISSINYTLVIVDYNFVVLMEHT